MRLTSILVLALCLLFLSMPESTIPDRALWKQDRAKWGVGYSTHEEVSQESIQATISLNAKRVRTWGHGRAKWWVEPLKEAGMIYHSSIFKPPLVDSTVPESYLAQLKTEAAANPGSVWIYGNEPEWQGLSPQDSALAFAQCRDAVWQADPGAKFIIGNVLWENRWGDNPGKIWLRDFISYLDTWDGVAGIGVHIYVDFIDIPGYCPFKADDVVKALLNAVDEVKEFSVEYASSRPIWITEIGQLQGECHGRQRFHKALITRALPRLDEDSQIAAHFWFATMADSDHDPGYDWCPGCLGSLLTDDLKGISDLGKLYAGWRRSVWVPALYRAHSGLSEPVGGKGD